MKLRIKQGKVPLFHLDELSNYYFSRFHRKIKYLELISGEISHKISIIYGLNYISSNVFD